METLQEKHAESHVETYFIDETVNLLYNEEDLNKWNELVEKLGLSGQREICKDDKSPIPFTPMNITMKNVFKTLLPVARNVEKYNTTPIPVEILRLVDLSVREKYFGKIEIWYDEKQKDPACVGILENYMIQVNGSIDSAHGEFDTIELAEKYILDKSIANAKAYHTSWNDKYYLIARWADVAQSFDQLIDRAKKRFLNENKTRLSIEIKRLKREYSDIELKSAEMFGI